MTQRLVTAGFHPGDLNERERRLNARITALENKIAILERSSGVPIGSTPLLVQGRIGELLGDTSVTPNRLWLKTADSTWKYVALSG